VRIGALWRIGLSKLGDCGRVIHQRARVLALLCTEIEPAAEEVTVLGEGWRLWCGHIEVYSRDDEWTRTYITCVAA